MHCGAERMPMIASLSRTAVVLVLLGGCGSPKFAQTETNSNQNMDSVTWAYSESLAVTVIHFDLLSVEAVFGSQSVCLPTSYFEPGPISFEPAYRVYGPRRRLIDTINGAPEPMQLEFKTLKQLGFPREVAVVHEKRAQAIEFTFKYLDDCEASGRRMDVALTNDELKVASIVIELKGNFDAPQYR